MNKSILLRNLDLPNICGAKTRGGYPCKNAPRLPSLRCSKHGGETPILHGKRTRYAAVMRKRVKSLRLELRHVQKEIESYLKKGS